MLKPVTIFLVLAFCNWNPVVSDDQPTTQSAKKTATAWANAYNDNNADKLMDFYENSQDLTVIVSGGISHQGYKEMANLYRMQFKEVQFFESTAKNLSAKVFANTAIVNFEHLAKFRVPAEDGKWQVHIRTTLVLQLKNGKWKIAGEHSSPINGVQRVTKIEE